jgi:hypothetical protein
MLADTVSACIVETFPENRISCYRPAVRWSSYTGAFGTGTAHVITRFCRRAIVNTGSKRFPEMPIGTKSMQGLFAGKVGMF